MAWDFLNCSIKDDAQAAEWGRKSAEAGDAVGMGLLGLCYEHCTGVEKDEAQAQYWKQRVIEAGREEKSD